MDNSIQLNQVLSLDLGTYTVTASTNSNSGPPSLGGIINSDLSANARYSISISIVPEPSSVTLAAIGVLGLVVAYFGRIRLAFQRSSLTN